MVVAELQVPSQHFQQAMRKMITNHYQDSQPPGLSHKHLDMKEGVLTTQLWHSVEIKNMNYFLNTDKIKTVHIMKVPTFSFRY